MFRSIYEMWRTREIAEMTMKFSELDFNLFKQPPMEKKELIDFLNHTTALVGSRCVVLECLYENETKNILDFYLPGEYNNLLEALASLSLAYSIVYFRVNLGDGTIKNNREPGFAIITLVEQADHSTNIDADVIQSIMEQYDWLMERQVVQYVENHGEHRGN